MESFSVPSSAKKFNDFQNTVIRLLVANGVAWGVLPLATTNVLVMQTSWATAYTLSTGKSTKIVGNTVNRNALKLPFVIALKSIFEKYLINNPLISSADQVSLGLHLVGGAHASIPPPSTQPTVIFTFLVTLVQTVKLRNITTGKRGKPAGVGFCEIWYKIGDPAPLSFTDCINKVNIGKSDETITYSLADKGKNAYYFARWVSKQGIAGPWTAVFSAVIA
jgi:hypothetical protein